MQLAHAAVRLSEGSSPLPLKRVEVAVAVLAAIVLSVLFHAERMDDAFISFRYGQNLALGRGLVFNPGDKMMGSTSPMHCLLAAAGYLLLGKDALPSAMSVLGVIAWVLQAVALRKWLEGVCGVGVARVTAGLVLLGGANHAPYVPLETHLVMAANLWGLWWASRGARWKPALLFAFAIWVRPDAALFAAAMALPMLRQHGKKIVAPAAVAMGLAALWPVFAHFYFGSSTPQSLHTKFQSEPLGKYLLHELTYLPSAIWPLVTEADPLEVAMPHPAWLVAIWLLVLAGGWRMRRAGVWASSFLLFGLLHAIAYAWLRPFVVHTWHLAPSVVWMLVLAVAGADLLLAKVPGDGKAKRLLTAGALLAVCLVDASALLERALYWKSTYWGGRDAILEEAAEALPKLMPGNGTAMAVEVGTMAYWSDVRFLDLGGLATPLPSRVRAPDGRMVPRGTDFDLLVLDDLYLTFATGVAVARIGPEPGKGYALTFFRPEQGTGQTR